MYRKNMKFLTAEKIRFKKNPTFSRSVVFAPLTQTYATELKEWTIDWPGRAVASWVFFVCPWLA
jgi:hypothetical protein